MHKVSEQVGGEDSPDQVFCIPVQCSSIVPHPYAANLPQGVLGEWVGMKRALKIHSWV